MNITTDLEVSYLELKIITVLDKGYTLNVGTIENPINNSKGCGGVMRVAPVGLFLHCTPELAFRVA